jgi:hypothetical protein
MKNTVVQLQVSSNSVDVEGNLISLLSDVKKISGILLPTTQEEMNKKYGYSNIVSYQFFYKGKENIELGSYINNLLVVHIVDYIKIKVILLKEVQIRIYKF